eukprot:2449302-Pyramimonas_sp.AAC.1
MGSLDARLGVRRGHSTVNQVEKAYVVSKHALDLSDHERLHYLGGNRGNLVGPIVAPSWTGEHVWQEQ